MIRSDIAPPPACEHGAGPPTCPALIFLVIYYEYGPIFRADTVPLPVSMEQGHRHVQQLLLPRPPVTANGGQ